MEKSLFIFEGSSAEMTDLFLILRLDCIRGHLAKWECFSKIIDIMWTELDSKPGVRSSVEICLKMTREVLLRSWIERCVKGVCLKISFRKHKNNCVNRTELPGHANVDKNVRKNVGRMKVQKFYHNFEDLFFIVVVIK